MYLLLAILLSGLELLYEALKFKGQVRLSEFIELAFLIIVTALSFFWLAGIDAPEQFKLHNPSNIIKVFIGYGLLRFGCFDILMNLIRGLEWYYTGGKAWDQFIWWLQKGIGTYALGFIQLIAGVLILIYVNNPNYRVLW